MGRSLISAVLHCVLLLCTFSSLIPLNSATTSTNTNIYGNHLHPPTIIIPPQQLREDGLYNVKIKWGREDNNNAVCLQRKLVNNDKTYFYNIYCGNNQEYTDLVEKHTLYHYRLVLDNEDLLSEEAALSTSAPTSPILNIEYIHDDSVSITWTCVQEIEGFYVDLPTYRVATQQGTDVTEVDVGTSTTYIATELDSTTEYTLCVKAVNMFGSSVPSCSVITTSVEFRDMMLREDNNSSTPEEDNNGVPYAPLAPQLSLLNSSSVLVSWLEPDSNGSVITNYELHVVVDGNDQFYNVTDTQYEYSMLVPNKQYTFIVIAINAYGSSISSESSLLSTFVPSAIALAPNIAAVTNVNVYVTWNRSDLPGDYVVTYVLQVVNATGFTTRYLAVNTTSYDVTMLVPLTQYTFSVIATNIFGESSASPTTTQTTYGPPTPPQSLSVTSYGLRFISLSWGQPLQTYGKTVDQYAITQSLTSDFSAQTTTYTTTATTYNVTSLRTFTTYYFRVQATTTYGTSSRSSSVNATTPGILPNPPNTPLTDQINTTTINVYWSPVVDNSGGDTPVQTYTLSFRDTTINSTYLPVYTGTATQYYLSMFVVGHNYRFVVAANNVVGSSANSASASRTFIGLPLTPGPPSAISINATSITIKWTQTNNSAEGTITQYVIQMRNASGIDSDYSILFAGYEPGFNYTVRNLVPNTAYLFRIQSVNNMGASAWSTPASISTYGAPSPPTLSQTPLAMGSSYITLQWQAPIQFDGSGISSYSLEMSSPSSFGVFLQLLTTSELTANVTSLTANTQYGFRLTAKNSYGTSDYSASVFITTQSSPPSAPQAPRVVIQDLEANTTVSWMVPTSNSPTPVLGYWLDMLDVSTSTWTNLYEGTALSYIVMNLAANSFYQFRVRAKNDLGYSPYSETTLLSTAGSVPGVPNQVSLGVQGSTWLFIIWSESDDTGLAITGYSLEISGVSVYNFTQTYMGNGLNHNVTGLSPRTSYQFRLRARNPLGFGLYSTPITFTTGAGTPFAPSTPVVSAITYTSFMVQWGVAGGNGSPVLYYIVDMKTGVLTPDENYVEVFSGNTTSCELHNINSQEIYVIRVSAVNAVGEGAHSNGTVATTNASVPSKPDPPQLVQSGDTYLTLSWTRPNNNGGYITLYHVYVAANSSNFTTFEDTTTTSVTITGLKHTTEYWARVVAVNFVGESESSEAQIFTTAPSTPSAPTIRSAYATSESSIVVFWSSPSNTGGAPIDYYTLEAQFDAQSAWTTVCSLVTLLNCSVSIVNTVEYRFRAAAINSAGAGNYSTVWSYLYNVSIPTAPGVPQTSAITGTSITLTWGAAQPNGAAGVTYILERLDPVSNKKRKEQNYGLSPSVPRSKIYPRNGFYAIYEGLETHYTVADLSPLAQYSFRVLAVSFRGNSAYSPITVVNTTAGVPLGPLNGTISVISNTTVYVRWLAASSGEGFSAFIVEDVNAHTIVCTTMMTSCNVTDLVPNTAYTFVIKAMNAYGNSSTSQTVSTTTYGPPNTPGNLVLLTSMLSDVSASFNWSFVPGNLPVLHFQVYLLSDAEYIDDLNNTALYFNTSQYNFTLNRILQSKVRYYVQVAAENIYGMSPYSPALVFTTHGLPDTPDVPTLGVQTNTSLEIRWRAPTSAVAITSYQLQQGDASKITFRTIYNSTNATITSYVASGLSPGTLYQYRLRASNRYGFSEYGPAGAFTALPGPPDPPPAPYPVSSVFARRIYLGWFPPSRDGGAPVTNYALYSDYPSPYPTLLYMGNNLTFNHTGLPDGLQVRYGVMAQNAVGWSEMSQLAVLRTVPNTEVPPVDTVEQQQRNTAITATTTVVVVVGVLLIGLGAAYFYVKRLKKQQKKREESIEKGIELNILGGTKDFKVKIDYAELRLQESIGVGSFGEVFLSKWRGSDVAVKKMRPNLLKNESAIANFYHEIAVMCELRHPHIVLFLGAVTDPPDICIITEYMHLHSLYDLLHSEKHSFNFFALLLAATDAARGMAYLHGSKPPILHRDLKSLNLLVSEEYRVKVSDFGLTTLFGHQQSKQMIIQSSSPASAQSQGSGSSSTPPGGPPSLDFSTITVSSHSGRRSSPRGTSSPLKGSKDSPRKRSNSTGSHVGHTHTHSHSHSQSQSQSHHSNDNVSTTHSFSSTDSAESEVVGSIHWTAPEVLRGDVYTEKADVYSFGIIMYEIFSGQVLYPDLDPRAIAVGVMERDMRPPIPQSMYAHPEIVGLMTACWDKAPEKRPSFVDILQILEDLIQNEEECGAFRQYLADLDPAPRERLALVFTDIQGSTQLWEAYPADMTVALTIHNEILRICIKRNGGYEVKTEGDAFMVAFQDSMSAVQFCLDVQNLLMNPTLASSVVMPVDDPSAPISAHTHYPQSGNGTFRSHTSNPHHSTTPRNTFVGLFSPGAGASALGGAGNKKDWPENILRSETAGEVRFNRSRSISIVSEDEANLSVSHDDITIAETDLIFRGMRVRMGVHTGNPQCAPDPITGRMDYFGPVVNRAARVSGSASGGQIFVSSGAWDDIHEHLDVLGNPVIEDKGDIYLKGLDTPEYVHVLYPAALGERLPYFAKKTANSNATPSPPVIIETTPTPTPSPSPSPTSSPDTTPVVPTPRPPPLPTFSLASFDLPSKRLTFAVPGSIPTSSITTGARIGQGTFGDVFHATWIDKSVAVKQMFRSKLKEIAMFEIRAEVTTACNLKHRHILPYHGFSVKPLRFVMDYATMNAREYLFFRTKSGRSLMTDNNPSPSRSDVEKFNIGYQIASGMAFLHSQQPPILHRNLKLENVLITQDQVVKLSDFGFAELRRVNAMTTQLRNMGVVPPEVLRAEPFVTQSDVFCFGALIYEIFTGSVMFSSKNSIQMAVLILQGTRPTFPQDTPNIIPELCAKCWEDNPELRPSFDEILKILKPHSTIKE